MKASRAARNKTLVAGVFLLVAVATNAAEPTLDSSLRKAFDTFPLLKAQKTEGGTPQFVPVELNREARITFGGKRYDGFRIKTPQKQTRSLTWAFYRTKGSQFGNWYILPRTDSPGFMGFTSFWGGAPKDMIKGPKPEEVAGKFYVQGLDWSKLEPDSEYLIWFQFANENPGQYMVAHTFEKSLRESDFDEMLAVFGFQRDPAKAGKK